MAEESRPVTPPRKNRWRDLETLSDVRMALARTCRALERASKHPEEPTAMSVDHARALVYAYSKLADLIRGGYSDDLMLRLEAVEARQSAGPEAAPQVQ